MDIPFYIIVIFSGSMPKFVSSLLCVHKSYGFLSVLGSTLYPVVREATTAQICARLPRVKKLLLHYPENGTFSQVVCNEIFVAFAFFAVASTIRGCVVALIYEVSLFIETQLIAEVCKL